MRTPINQGKTKRASVAYLNIERRHSSANPAIAQAIKLGTAGRSHFGPPSGTMFAIDAIDTIVTSARGCRRRKLQRNPIAASTAKPGVNKGWALARTVFRFVDFCNSGKLVRASRARA